eukprot:m.222904 g.222904  ORF g.222904 m.222904 type:complete len:925 (-) comp33386_c2_seq2:269-3043(-)
MSALPLFLLAVVASVAASATPPSGVDIARTSNVVWNDADWGNDTGLGSLPIGNGDVAVPVWIDSTTGDLRLLLRKSDVFDENSQPVTTGALRIRFTPPLYTPPPPTPPPPAWNCNLFNCTCQGLSNYYGVVSGSGFGCTPLVAQDWWTANKCNTNNQNGGNCVGPACELPGSAPCVPPPQHSSSSASASSSSTTNGNATTAATEAPPTFSMELDIATSTVTVRSVAGVTVVVSIDLNAPLVNGKPSRGAGIVRVTASSRTDFELDVMLEPFREERVSILGGADCNVRYEHADTIASVKNTLTWYHWNNNATTYQNDTLKQQGVDPESAGLPDIFTHRAFGATVAATGLTSVSPTKLTGSALQNVAVVATLLTLQPNEAPLETSWLDAIKTVVPSPSSTSSSSSSSDSDGVNDCGSQRACPTTWDELLERSYIELTAPPGSNDTTTPKQITDHVNWDRHLALIQGRAAFAPIKFNGQLFTANITAGKNSWDYRSWGAGYWWQNERQPYYNALAQGDLDTMRSFLDFYLRALPYVNARTLVQFNNTDAPQMSGIAALFPETTTQFGTYMPNQGVGWGCNSPIPRNHGASQNGYIRFHWTGALELSLMILDLYEWSGDVNDLERYLPIPFGVVEAYRQRFPNSDANGKTDMFPAQALETYQCGNPTSRADCPSNPTTDISGLMAVLPRLIALPEAQATNDQRTTWKQQLAKLPPLPLVAALTGANGTQKVAAIATGNGFPTSGGGSRGNSENTALYMAHPFRVFGIGKDTNFTLAQQTYIERHTPCNKGWCQDVIHAAMLNISDNVKGGSAATQVAQRASATDHGGFRFEGFAGHYQDFEPSLDHYGFMRTGLNYMLMAPLDDNEGGVVLFPSFPVNLWNVRFKIHAPRNTTIEASCQGGVLEYLIVTPASRASAVTVLNCKQPAST